VKEKCAVVACIMAAFCLSGVLRACAQDESFDLKVADLESRINVERDEVSDLRHRQVQAERQKSLLALEIEQEARRISKLNSEIKPASGRARTRASWKRAAPAAAPAACAPSEAVMRQQEPALSDPQSGAPDIDAESQAEIDRLVAMREKLIAERDSLEQIVKPAPGAP
jgi:chromosome segregation ATPase